MAAYLQRLKESLKDGTGGGGGDGNGNDPSSNTLQAILNKLTALEMKVHFINILIPFLHLTGC